jgi:agmatine deiminase
MSIYLRNGGAVMSEFGDPERGLLDHDTIAKAFPDRQIVQIGMNHLAGGGGSIYCGTQQEPVPLG